jgi:hypothetical protein
VEAFLFYFFIYFQELSERALKTPALQCNLCGIVDNLIAIFDLCNYPEIEVWNTG